MYRHYAPSYSPLSGEGARLFGGRWNPPGSFATLYTASDVVTVDAEFDRLLNLSRLPRESIRPRNLAAIRLRLSRVLDLRDASVRQVLGIGTEDLTADTSALTRTLGEAAHDLGFEAIVAPSAAGGQGYVVAVFLTNRAPGSEIEVVRETRYERAYATEADVEPTSFDLENLRGIDEDTV